MEFNWECFHIYGKFKGVKIRRMQIYRKIYKIFQVDIAFHSYEIFDIFQLLYVVV